MNKNVLPKPFKTWLEFYDELKKKYPLTLTLEKEEFTFIHFRGLCNSDKVMYKFDTSFMYKQIVNELDNLRVSRNEINQLQWYIQPDCPNHDKFIRLLNVLAKD